MTDTQTITTSRGSGGAITELRSDAITELRSDAITELRSDAITELRSDEPAFRLRGVPAVGRWTRLLARVPLLTAWVRPRLHVDEVCLVLAWGLWVRRVPLSTIVRISLTDRGIALGLSDSTKVELLTFGGLSCTRARHHAFNELLCAHVHACRRRALARALRSHRTRGG